MVPWNHRRERYKRLSKLNVIYARPILLYITRNVAPRLIPWISRRNLNKNSEGLYYGVFNN